jgi:single-stranded-DNA-specific exonuclease
MGAPSILNHLANARGIAFGGAKESFGHDARLYPHTERALDRIHEGVARRERIGIFGDYDCDGITSTALLVRFFRRRNIEPVTRLPHRLFEGYGLKETHIKEFAKQGVTLLITVDTGIGSAKEIALARSLGIDVIVFDHHHVPETVPNAHSIIHPALAPDFPLPHPAAAGVTWSMVRALEEREGVVGWEDMETDIAFAAIGTVADLVELRGGNRTLVEQGIEAIKSIKSGPLSFLTVQAGLMERCTCRDIAFKLAPRINAAGRMADPHIALQALLGHQESLLALEQLNQDRQAHVASLFEDSLTTLKADSGLILLASTDYSPGIVGLLAGKLTEKFGRPSLVANITGEVCTASLRSIPGYNITQGLGKISDLLLTYGGHAQAAGCSFLADALPIIHDRMSRDIEATLSPEELLPLLPIDAALTEHMITLELSTLLQELEPFGQGNPEPRFLIPNAKLIDARTVGKDNTHLQAKFGAHKIIGFGLGKLLEATTKPLDLVARLSVDTWNGRTSVQLMLDDVRIAVPEQKLVKV